MVPLYQTKSAAVAAVADREGLTCPGPSKSGGWGKAHRLGIGGRAGVAALCLEWGKGKRAGCAL